MPVKQHGTSGSASKSEESKQKIASHKKSTDVSSSAATQKNNNGSKKNIQKTGTMHDDWNDPTGNSHINRAK